MPHVLWGGLVVLGGLLAGLPSTTAAGLGWRTNTSHASSPCTIPVVDASELSLAKLAHRCAHSTTPLLIRGIHAKPKWRAAIAALGNRTALLENFGAEKVRLSLSAYLAQGPEKVADELDSEKLAFMKEAWQADGSDLRSQLLQQVGAGEARPWVQLGEFVGALRGGTAPADAYIFHNISAHRAITHALAPLHQLWREITLAQLEQYYRELPDAQAAHSGGKSNSLHRARARVLYHDVWLFDSARLFLHVYYLNPIG